MGGQVEKILRARKANAHPSAVAAQKIVFQGVFFPVLPLRYVGADGFLRELLLKPLCDALKGCEGPLVVPVVVRPVEIPLQRFRRPRQLRTQVKEGHAVLLQQRQQAVGVFIAVVFRALGHQAAVQPRLPGGLHKQEGGVPLLQIPVQSRQLVSRVARVSLPGLLRQHSVGHPHHTVADSGPGKAHIIAVQGQQRLLLS